MASARSGWTAASRRSQTTSTSRDGGVTPRGAGRATRSSSTSTGYDERTWVDYFGYPHSDQMVLEERYTRINYDTLELKMTLTDPKYYREAVGGRDEAHAPAAERLHQVVGVDRAARRSVRAGERARIQPPDSRSGRHRQARGAGLASRASSRDLEIQDMLQRTALGLLAATFATAALGAHHGTLINYDRDKPWTSKAVVIEFHYVNPHAQIFFDVTDAKGKVTHYSGELLPNPAQFVRNGWTKKRAVAALQTGTVIRITVAPARAGADDRPRAAHREREGRRAPGRRSERRRAGRRPAGRCRPVAAPELRRKIVDSFRSPSVPSMVIDTSYRNKRFRSSLVRAHSAGAKDPSACPG